MEIPLTVSPDELFVESGEFGAVFVCKKLDPVLSGDVELSSLLLSSSSSTSFVQILQ